MAKMSSVAADHRVGGPSAAVIGRGGVEVRKQPIRQREEGGPGQQPDRSGQPRDLSACRRHGESGLQQ
jgi:hypothetical protein